MADISAKCFLLVVVSSLSLICGSEPPRMNAEEFPTSSKGFLPNNRSSYETGKTNSVDSSRRDEMSRVMETHLLRMLKLSSRPPSSVAVSPVPGYVMAVQHAIDTVPLSTVTDNDNDHLTWAVKAVQGIYLCRGAYVFESHGSCSCLQRYSDCCWFRDSIAEITNSLLGFCG